MKNRRSLMAAALVAAAFSIPAGACSLEPDSPIPPTAITRIQAFKCGVPQTESTSSCQVRGEAIPRDSLPPADEFFMVWVWHPGSNETVWRLLSSLDPGTPVRALAYDSVAVSYTLSGAAAKTYVVRVQIEGIGDAILAEDSLRWVFP